MCAQHIPSAHPPPSSVLNRCPPIPQAQQSWEAQAAFEAQAAAQHCGFGCMVSQPWEEETGCSPTASEDSSTSACSPLDFSFSSTNEASPFADARENSRSRRPGSTSATGFSLPALRLPNLRAIKTSAAGAPVKAVPAAMAPVPKALTVPSAKLSSGASLGRPPLAAGSLRGLRSGSLQKGGSYQQNGSVELVAAWGQIRGQVHGSSIEPAS
jgi:hypothetical protein